MRACAHTHTHRQNVKRQIYFCCASLQNEQSILSSIRRLYAATIWMQSESGLASFLPPCGQCQSTAVVPLMSLLKARHKKWERNGKRCRVAKLKLSSVPVNGAAAAAVDTLGLIYGSVTCKHIKRR